MSNKENIGLKAVLLRELRRITSQRIYLIMIFFLPSICFLFFGTFMESGLPSDLPIGIIDQDNSPTSRNAIRQLDATQECDVVSNYCSFSDARRAMQEGKIYAFVNIPKDFEKDIFSNRQPELNFYYNSAYLITGSLSNKALSKMCATISGAVKLKTMTAKGINQSIIMGQLQPIVPDIHAIGNPWINYSVYLINVILPGLLGLIILLTIVYTIGIELKQDTGHEWLNISGNNMSIAIIGKMIPYTIGFTIMAIFCDIMLFRMLNYPLNNNILWMFLASFLFVMANQALGVFMIGTFPVLRDALSFASLFGVLAFSFAGLSFPIEGMMPMFQGWSYLFPIRHFFIIYQDIALNGLAPIYAIPNCIYLLLFLLVPFTVGKRLKNALVYGRYPKK